MEMINRNRLAEEVAAVVANGGQHIVDGVVDGVGVVEKKPPVKKPAKKRTRAKARKRA